MPRAEARIFTSIWRDDDFVALPPGAQRLYMFLLSQPELTYCGTMPLRLRRWVPKAAGLTLAELGQDLKVLESAGFVVTDAETGELLIRAMMRRDSAWKQPNLLKQATVAADEIESPLIRRALLAELLRLPVDESPSEQVRTLVADLVTDLSQGVRQGSGYPSPDPEPGPSPDHGGDPPGNPEDKRAGEGTAKDHACARELGECYCSSEEMLQAPSSKSPMTPRAARNLGTRMPDPFPVTGAMAEWARQACPHVDGRGELDRFEDYWRAKPGKDGRKRDWVATWRNWMRTAEDRAMPRQRAPARRQEATDQLFQRAAERIAAQEGTHDAAGSPDPRPVRQGLLPAAGDG